MIKQQKTTDGQVSNGDFVCLKAGNNMAFGDMQLGWVDISRQERGDITAILRLLGTSAALDEIGIGTIRDGFSNLLFPGLSTQQTRVKYFVLVLYLFSLAEEQNFSRPGEVGPWIHRQEDALVKTLVKNGKDGAFGIIGARNLKQNKTLARRPSELYWTGLRAASILRWPDLSFGEACSLLYARQQEKKGIRLKAERGDMRGDDRDALQGNPPLFCPLWAEYDLFSDATIELTPHEAAYLRERFYNGEQTRPSLLAYLLRHPCQIRSRFRDLDTGPMPKALGEITSLARDFSVFIYGAHLLYNVIFSNGKDLDMVSAFDRWKAEDYAPMDLDRILLVSGASPSAGTFVRAFDACISKGNISAAQRCILQRETAIKGDRAKLGHPEWYQPIHHYHLDFRYAVGVQMISDILRGWEGYHGTQII